jgi:hypothetical protein
MNQFDYQRALFSSELTANDRLTAIVIGSHYNWKTREVSFPSNKTIARESGLSIRSVIRSKNNLVKHGYLVSDRRYDMSNTYIPRVPQSHDGCQSGNLIDTLKDNLKDTLKDTITDSKESVVEDINIKIVEEDDIWEDYTPIINVEHSSTINEEPLTNKESEPRPTAPLDQNKVDWLLSW